MAVQIDVSSLKHTQQCKQVHHIPCKIDHNGPAKVEQFFECNVRPSDGSDEGITGMFRGRPLQGEKRTIPEGYTAVVLKEMHKVYDEEEDRTFKATHSFKEYTHWNLDMPASANDKIVAAMQWIDIASAIHEPVSIPETKINGH